MRSTLLWRGLAASGLAVWVGFSVAADAPDYTPPPRDKVRWVDGIPRSSVHKRLAPGTVSLDECPPGPCKVDITVTVNNDSSGRDCSIRSSPDILIVKSDHVPITFTLTELVSHHQARFNDDQAGIRDGIFIVQPPGQHHFNNRNYQAQKIVWTRNVATTPGQMFGYSYDINVVHDLGAGKCDVPDPIIINRD